MEKWLCVMVFLVLLIFFNYMKGGGDKLAAGRHGQGRRVGGTAAGGSRASSNDFEPLLSLLERRLRSLEVVRAGFLSPLGDLKAFEEGRARMFELEPPSSPGEVSPLKGMIIPGRLRGDKLANQKRGCKCTRVINYIF